MNKQQAWNAGYWLAQDKLYNPDVVSTITDDIHEAIKGYQAGVRSMEPTDFEVLIGLDQLPSDDTSMYEITHDNRVIVHRK